MQRYDWLHYIPAAIQLIACLPYITSSHLHKVSIVKQISQMNNILFNENPFNGISYRILYVSVFISVVFYGIVMFRLLRAKNNTQTNEHFRQVYSWSRWVTWIMLFMALFMFVNVFVSSASITTTANFIYFGPFYAIRLFLFSIFFYRILLSSRIRLGLPNLNSNRRTIELTLSKNKQVLNEKTLAEPNSKSTTELFADLLDQFFKTQQDKYTQQGFNLELLADATQIPQHHWAYYFRYHSALSFVELRNYHRIQFAKSLIVDPNYANITLEAIGKSAGFGSRTTFFNAFKKFEGISPSDFLKMIEHSTGSAKF
jgi:AraC-like DNA-binding protein